MIDVLPWQHPDATELTKTEFDKLVRTGQFADGPVLSAYGDGYGDPYNPDRQAGGTLKDGRIVWTWVKGAVCK